MVNGDKLRLASLMENPPTSATMSQDWDENLRWVAVLKCNQTLLLLPLPVIETSGPDDPNPVLLIATLPNVSTYRLFGLAPCSMKNGLLEIPPPSWTKKPFVSPPINQVLRLLVPLF